LLPTKLDLSNPVFYRGDAKLTITGKFNIFPWSEQKLPVGPNLVGVRCLGGVDVDPRAGDGLRAKSVVELAKKKTPGKN